MQGADFRHGRPLICIDLSNLERIFIFSLFHGAVCGEQNGQMSDVSCRTERFYASVGSLGWGY